ncbi:MAG: hypothetical protein A2041_00565 [Bacteroidetes bacterium GWA2_31_9b]|nr:MAG: hypothetical protein A2041_00565 [Bacteroidetes bacterium GWA2_31_9b]
MDTLKNFEKSFLIEEINENKYIIYNVDRHIPIIVDKTGKKFFDIILNNRDLESCKKSLLKNEFDDFVLFLKEIGNLQVLDTSPSETIKPKNNPPKTAYLHLTYKCNLNCNYCYNKDVRNKFVDLPFEKWKNIIDKLLPTTNYFILTGGEPFLFKDLKNIINYIHSYNSEYQVEILSNGMINFSEYSDSNEVFNNIHRITFSCDNFKSNNQVRKGFEIEEFKKNLEWIIKNGYAEKVGLSSVYYKENLEGTIEVQQYCKSHCMQHRRVLVIPNNRDEINIMPSLESFLESLGSNEAIYDLTTFFKRLNCGAGVGLISIDPEGNCYPCQNLHYDKFNCGNILNKSYKEILDSEVINLFRSDLIVENISTCNECKLRYICGGGCRAASYRLEGKIDAFPEVMCSYYKSLAKHKLINGVFFTPSELLNRKDSINKLIEKEFII